MSKKEEAKNPTVRPDTEVAAVPKPEHGAIGEVQYLAKTNIRRGGRLYKQGDTISTEELGADCQKFARLGFIEKA